MVLELRTRQYPLVAAFLLLAGCTTSDEEVRQTLDNAGFTDVTVTGSALWVCGEHDKMGNGFTATNPRGKRVKGVVCCGQMKACTVRF